MANSAERERPGAGGTWANGRETLAWQESRRDVSDERPALRKSMRTIQKYAIYSAFVCMVGMAAAQSKPTYLDTSLAPEQRAAALVKQMTLDEKVSQLVNQARAIPRLGVPAYDWWSEALHGVVNDGVTTFPGPIGLGATFDAPAIHKMAEVISTEGRIKHMQAVREKRESMFFQGLDFWAPNINIFRDPRWGRGQ